MNRFLLALVVILGITLTASAQARVFFSVGLGPVCCGYAPYYAPSYYNYPAYYYAPPPSVTYYAPAPTVVYTPPPVTYVQPPAQPVAQMAPNYTATQAAPTYTDGQGRTCRQFQSSIDGAPVTGTACLQPDGTWRTTGQ